MNKKDWQNWLKSSALTSSNQAYIEDLYEIYLTDASQLEPSWQKIFAEFPTVNLPLTPLRHPNLPSAKSHTTTPANSLAFFQLTERYRTQGYRHANLNPLTPPPAPIRAEITLTFAQQAEIAQLERAYCGTLAVELIHLEEVQRAWLQAQFEAETPDFSAAQQRQILEELIAAEGLERHLGAKFAGAKRFSLEGGDAFVLLVKSLIRHAASNQICEIVFGMAHRGRLNMLVNVFGKTPHALFAEFAGTATYSGSGDVKYHQGASCDFMTENGSVHLNLAYNPSHLEIVSPVIQGAVRARQDRIGDCARTQVLPVTVHGDSAIAGQGIVQETLNMAKTRGYGVGGTVRIVINNQIGFTTSNPEDTRSMPNCTDVAKMIAAPILHVNADDPEAVVRCAQLAVAYRQTFHQDIFINLLCYRRHGHNEADEPALTQPLMYQQIKKHPSVVQLYAERLKLDAATLQTLKDRYRQGLEANQTMVAEWRPSADSGKHWAEFFDENAGVIPPLAADQFDALAHQITQIPAEHHLHNRVQKVYADRQAMAAGEKAFDWGMGETMAYASLLQAGWHVRISGEDAGRATFSHRHAALHDQKNAAIYFPLQHLASEQGRFEVWDSVLSEEGVLAFEYGYASTDPCTLTVWEAQFGDFANGAQIVIDQFISASEQKWGRFCGLTMLLPHGYEGQGPEHSSARLERYLQLCAENNLRVCIPTTPAQIYHLLRRQQLQTPRRPLIVISPKSLLRHPQATSTREAFLHGGYQTLLDDINLDSNMKTKVQRVVLCSGKVYYDLLAERQACELTSIALIRLEQLYPFPSQALATLLTQYPAATELIWCQEEPQNQGAWTFVQPYLQQTKFATMTLSCISRPAAAATATGDAKRHQTEQQTLVTQTLTLN